MARQHIDDCRHLRTNGTCSNSLARFLALHRAFLARI
jgi:hypothetical protein